MINTKTLVTISCLIGTLNAASGTAKDNNAPTEDKIGALMAVVAFGALGGFIVQVIQGMEIGRFKIKPLCTAI